MSYSIFDLRDIAYFAVWYAPLAVCYFAWPMLKLRRAYVVAAAALVLAPAAGIGYAAWPMFVTVFQMLAIIRADAAGKAEYLLVFCLPVSAIYAAVAWRIARRFIPPAGSAPAGGSQPGRARARLRRTLSGTSPLRHMGRLSLLLAATVAYAMMCNFVL